MTVAAQKECTIAYQGWRCEGGVGLSMALQLQQSSFRSGSCVEITNYVLAAAPGRMLTW